MDTIQLSVRDPGRQEQLVGALEPDFDVRSVDGSGDEDGPFSPADLLVLDLGTFRQVGTDGIERYRAQEPNVASPVLLLAARPQLSRLDSVVWEHVDEVIGAPVRRAELKGRIRSLLRLRRYAREAEAARSRISSKYKALFDSSALGIVLLEGDEIREANARAGELLGAAPEALAGRTLSALSPSRQPEGPPSVEAAEALLREARTEGEAQSEWRFDPDSPDGGRGQAGRAPFWAELTLSPVSHDGDEWVQMMFWDVTDRKQAEARFRLQTHILQQVAEGASLRPVLADLVEGIEEQRPGMLGSVQLYDSEEGRIRHGAAPNLPDAYNEAVDGIAVGPNAGSCGTAMHTRSKVVAEDITEDPRWRDYRDLAISHDLRACWSVPILGSGDEVLGSFAMYYREPQSPTEADEALIELARSLARIAIERHRNEQSLRKERDRFATLFHNLPTPVVHGRAEDDETVRVQTVNEAFERVFGYEASTVEGRDLDELVVPAERQQEAAEINRRVKEEGGYQAVVRRETVHGMRDFRLQVTQRSAGEGAPEEYAIYVDVTEEHRRRERRERQQEALLELTNDERVVSGKFDAAIRKITERAAEVLGVARVNVWLFDEEGHLRCEDHYEQSSGEHSSGMELSLEQYPSYFEALSAHRVIEASDAQADPRTAELVEDYLRPRGIDALLDATLHSEGKVRGVVCHEHVGGTREWKTDEIQFAGEIGDIVHRTLRNREQAERRRELAFQQSLLKAQQEAVLDGMLVVDEEQRIVSYNDRFTELWEVPEELPEQGDDEPVLDWVTNQVKHPGEFLEKVEYLYDHPGERSRDEIELADGRVFDRYTTPMEGKDGTHYGRLWTFRDITGRKRREKELRLFKQVIEQANDAVLVTEARPLDEPGPKITYANPAFEEMTGYDRAEIKGKTPRILQGPETDREVIDSLRTALENEESWSGETINYRKDGEPFPLRWSVAPVQGKDGIEHWVSIQRDVTEQKRREQRLRESRRKIEALYEATGRLLRAESREAVSDCIHDVLQDVFDYPLNNTGFLEDGVIVPEKTATDEETLVPRPVPQPIEGDSVSARILRVGETVVVEAVDTLDNSIDYGDLRSVAGVPIGDRGVIIVGSAEDQPFEHVDLHLIEVLAHQAALVLERLAREEELLSAKKEAEEAARLKSAMLANMSHEIRTPLTAINGFAEVLKDALEGEPQSFAERIYESGQRLMKTLDSVLQLAKLEAGVYEMDREVVSLREVVEETAEMLRPTAEEKSLALEAKLSETPVEGPWNEGALNRIVRNLLENAIKFTPAGGRVTVRSWAENEAAVLEVEDTGVGISEGAVPEIFRAFKQESEGLDRAYEGSGLGLSIVKRLTDALGGEITVESEKGEGTCFRVVLPRGGNGSPD